MISDHTAAIQVRLDCRLSMDNANAKGASITGSGNSLILLLRTFKYRSNVHSANRAGKDEILL